MKLEAVNTVEQQNDFNSDTQKLKRIKHYDTKTYFKKFDRLKLTRRRAPCDCDYEWSL